MLYANVWHKGLDWNRGLQNVFQRLLMLHECLQLRSVLFQSLRVRTFDLQTTNNSKPSAYSKLEDVDWEAASEGRLLPNRECPCGWSLKQLSSCQLCQVHLTGVPRLLEPHKAKPGDQITGWAEIGNIHFLSSLFNTVQSSKNFTFIGKRLKLEKSYSLHSELKKLSSLESNTTEQKSCWKLTNHSLGETRK